MTRTRLGALAICVAAGLWGLDGVVLTPRLAGLPVPFVVFLLHAVPFLLMQPFLGKSYRAMAALSPSAWVTVFLVALCGGLLGTLAIVKALFLVNFNQLSVVILLQKLQPIFAILLAAVLLKERIGPRFALWAALAVVGGYLLTFGTAVPDMDAPTMAAIWAVVAAAAFGAATVLGKRLLGQLDFWQATFARYGVTTVLAALYLVLAGDGFPFGAVTSNQWLIILIIGLTTGSGAILLYYWGLTRVRAQVATLCELTLPLSAVLFDYAVNGSRLSWVQLAGAALLIWAILRVSRREESTSQPGEPEAAPA